MKMTITKHGAVLSQTMDPFSTWVYSMTEIGPSKRVWRLTKDGSWSTQPDRQNYVDHHNPLTCSFGTDVNIKYLHTVHFMAWKHGLKTLYYCRSEKIGKADKVKK